jgi:hypothetical protein
MENKQTTNLAPIVLFTYNRPEHTKLTLEALKKNYLANNSTLYIYCDGSRDNMNDANISNISQVRQIVRMEQWCGSVNIIESENNKGLAKSIKTGVSEIVLKYGKVIVMEDDLVTSPAFLTYMNKALDYYENYKSVFSISAYCLPASKFKVPEDYKYDVFVSLRNSSWGWGTWYDRWQQINWDVKVYETIRNTETIKQAFNRGGDDVFDLLEMQQSGKLNIWSIQFTVAHFVNHAVSIVPTLSYVDNIGHDGSGENCLPGNGLKNQALNNNENVKFLDVLYEDKQVINAFYNAYCRIKRPLWQKIINRLSRTLGRNNVFSIKRKIYR